MVIGAGVAGLRAAIELAARAGSWCWPSARSPIPARNGRKAESPPRSATKTKSACILQDTLNAGDGLCNPEAAKVLVEEAPERIEELIAWGTQFDREGTKLDFGREGAHSRNRILHAHGDSTGREILRALYAKAKTLKNISVLRV